MYLHAVAHLVGLQHLVGLFQLDVLLLRWRLEHRGRGTLRRLLLVDVGVGVFFVLLLVYDIKFVDVDDFFRLFLGFFVVLGCGQLG